MYALCFWAWPRPKATPRPDLQPLIFTPKGDLRTGVDEGAGKYTEKAKEALGVVFGLGIIYVFVF